MKTVVVLAGGRGMRLWPLTEKIPKPMVPIDDRPIMEFVVAALRSSGFGRLLVILQFNPGPIVEHFRDGSDFGIPVDYILQEGELGTAGSVRQALEFFDGEDFAVVSSDILFHGDLIGGAEFHQSRKSAVTIVLSSAEDPSEFGVVSRGSDGRILEFQEKPPAGHQGTCAVNAGIYFLNRRVVEGIPQDRPVDFGREVFPRLLSEGARIYGWDLPGYWRDIGTFDGLKAARRDVRMISTLKAVTTRWPSPRSGEGGRIWIRKRASAREWVETDTASLIHASEVVSRFLSEHAGGEISLTEIRKLGGLEPGEANAAVGWLSREGKLKLKQEGRRTVIEFAPEELHATAH